MYRTITQLEKRQHPWVIAHRGYRAKYPENTLAAFDAAIQVGADMIELDVCLSEDRIPVVIHDETLDRTTDGNGIVQEKSLEELKQLDAGSWFSPQFKGEKIPTLEEVLLQVQGKISVNIEIKPEGFEEKQKPDSIEIQVCQLVRDYEMEDEVLISSFNHAFFPRMEKWLKTQTMKNALRFAPLQEDHLEMEELLQICHRYHAFAFHPDESLVTREMIEKMSASEFPVLTYTVNEKKRMKELMDWGISGIFTDEPELMIQSIQEIS